jgi:hypothetical protein
MLNSLDMSNTSTISHSRLVYAYEEQMEVTRGTESVFIFIINAFLTFVGLDEIDLCIHAK